ncbi:armadillo repeat-containing kinesin-like protein [Klebsormidium nitens]|uniref:Armadillo repeat-containing kinesin-like protein n=1 Tax=Klebsormidium nitens TaxID=105231 RepID=A0A1Y1HKL9_KLENI|nr:armadillo repeat-containing kinesin-like protein [Klebsormidium nitens]|eukprot:GAQ78172.1 armadillo repeat-containing kinesin-like protein [Klebsormidium nitens]
MKRTESFNKDSPGSKPRGPSIFQETTSKRPHSARQNGASVQSPPKDGSATARRSSKGDEVPKAKKEEQLAGRVRVVVRLRPRTADETKGDKDFADVVFMEPEIKRVTLKKNHWETDSYFYDTVLPDHASQKKVYETVTQPVVESVLQGYNGTVLAYGQTGTGKTHTLANIGLEDKSARGMMVRAVEDLFEKAVADTEYNTSIKLSYVQMYMEMVQDLLRPENANITLYEDPDTKEVTMPGVEEVMLDNLDHCISIMEVASKSRVVANQKMNASSSRSHALMILTVLRQPKDADKGENIVLLRRGKLYLADLAGSERINKSGSAGHMADEAKSINLSLTTLGKCINCLTEPNPGHIPYRESKLTRLLKDSFGGSARTSLIITIGPNPEHFQETLSTLQFGQRALKVQNNLKIQEDLDYRLLSKRQQAELDKLTAAVERLEGYSLKLETSLAQSNETVTTLTQTQAEERAHFEVTVSRLEKEAAETLEAETSRLHKEYKHKLAESAARTEELQAELDTAVRKGQEDLKRERTRAADELARAQSEAAARFADTQAAAAAALAEAKSSAAAVLEQATRSAEQRMEAISARADELADELRAVTQKRREEAAFALKEEKELERRIEDEKTAHEQTRRELADSEERCKKLNASLAETKSSFWGKSEKKDAAAAPPVEEPGRIAELNALVTEQKASLGTQSKEVEQLKLQLAMTTKLFEQVGVGNLLVLLKSDDVDICRTSTKALANLAAQESHQQEIVRLGGLRALFDLITRTTDETTHRLAAGAIANLAMSEPNQLRIVEEGGLPVLVNLGQTAVDPQTQRMVAGAIANLCGNLALKEQLVQSGGMRTFVSMAASKHPDVLAQVARGIANFVVKYDKADQFLDEGGLRCLVEMAGSPSLPVKKHAGLALYSLAQRESNAARLLQAGAVDPVVAMKRCDRDGIQRMAEKTLACLVKFNGSAKVLIEVAEAKASPVS